LNFFLFHQQGFMDLVQATWGAQVHATSSAIRIAAKFKILSRVHKNGAKVLASSQT
jgi:hypothetical protein